MKQLSDSDLKKMICTEFMPDEKHVKKQVRAELKLSQRIPEPPQPAPRNAVLDLHNKTEEQAWDAINALLRCGTRSATIITGASGILKIKFQQWVSDSLITPYITSCRPINNGAFEIRIKKNRQT